LYPIIGVATIIVSTGYFCLGISNPKVLNAKSDLVKETDKEKADQRATVKFRMKLLLVLLLDVTSIITGSILS
jgi:hypothetical protein